MITSIRLFLEDVERLFQKVSRALIPPGKSISLSQLAPKHSDAFATPMIRGGPALSACNPSITSSSFCELEPPRLLDCEVLIIKQRMLVITRFGVQQTSRASSSDYISLRPIRIMHTKSVTVETDQLLPISVGLTPLMHQESPRYVERGSTSCQFQLKHTIQFFQSLPDATSVQYS